MSHVDKHSARVKKLKLLKENLPFFAKTALKIRNKEGLLQPFAFNRAQMYIHQKLEDQKKNLGYVRALILKGRQQGCSTYVSARFYQKTIFNPESSTFILSHQAKTTGPLFDMVKRYHDNMPRALAPETDTSNRNQMKFAFPAPDDRKLISEYTVGTAGSEDIGRGFTIKHLHCSEAAFYEKTDELETGLFQAVAELPGTELIMESTANGIGNMFYRKAMDALAGKGIYQLIFVPWYWQAEYRTPLRSESEFVLEPQETKLKELYGLDDEQILWRRNKITSLGSEWKFQQEYPMNATEAFVVSGASLIDKEKLLEARKSKITDMNAPIIVGVDCARSNDRTVITVRRGRQIVDYFVLENTPGDTGPKSVELAQYVERLIKKYNPQKVFFDYAQGYGAIDLLRSWGYQDIVQGVYFNQKPSEPDVYLNKRSEMAINARDWIHDGNVNIPDADDFFTECALIPEYKETPTKKKYLVPKSEIKEKLGGLSTDIWDSFILTFAFSVNYDTVIKRSSANRKTVKRSSPYQTTQRISGAQKRPSKSVKVNF